LEAGGIVYIAKPINPMVLRARVRNHLELKQSRDALEKLARLYGLTGLINRRSFDTAIDREWRRSLRTRQNISVIIIDVDYFKPFNDVYGHAVGDSCLK
jgi:PleD family two-component response regulator